MLKAWVFLILLCGSAEAAELFSQSAWREIAPIYETIRKHPFNTELVSGKLPAEKFAYYSAQDSLYLVDFGRALALLATKLEDSDDRAMVLEEVKSTAAEKRVGESGAMGPATLMYTSYLLATAANKSREELAAALLPCYWIYAELGVEFLAKVDSKHPYYDWIKLYGSSKYAESVRKMIALVDKLAARTTAERRSKMLEAFIRATRLELLFWSAAYTGPKGV